MVTVNWQVYPFNLQSKKQLNLSHKRIEDGDGNQQLEPSKSLSKKLKFIKLDRL